MKDMENEEVEQFGCAKIDAFRFRDLPEELQSLIIRKCLPKWSLHLVLPTDHVCGHADSQSRNSASEKRALQYGIHRNPKLSSTLLLVDKCMSEQVIAESDPTFTGKLNIDHTLVTRLGDQSFGNCCCRMIESQRQIITEALGSRAKTITVVQASDGGFWSFDPDLIQVLPHLRMVVGLVTGSLFDGYIYGFGSQDYLIRNITEEAVERLRADCMARNTLMTPSSGECTDKLQSLWQVGLATILEMKVKVGAASMQFSFVCVYCVRPGEDFQPVYVPLGRFSTEEWSILSESFKMSLYARGSYQVP